MVPNLQANRSGDSRQRIEEQFRHLTQRAPEVFVVLETGSSIRYANSLVRTAWHMEPVAVLFLDLDDFKAVNDCFGHGAGDRLLIAVGRRLQSCLRSEDTVARPGGDEFVILVDSARAAGYVAERIISVTASIGIAESTPPQDRCEELLRRADVTIYRVKRNGKAHSEPFCPGSPPARVPRAGERSRTDGGSRGFQSRPGGRKRCQRMRFLSPGGAKFVESRALRICLALRKFGDFVVRGEDYPTSPA